MASVEVNQDELMRLLRSVARKDRQAFQRLYSQVAARMFGLCVKLANHRELAEEAMQESFIQIWHHAGEYHRDRGAPLAWMMTIARYRTLDLMRARKVRQTAGDEHLEQVEDKRGGPMDDSLRTSGAAPPPPPRPAARWSRRCRRSAPACRPRRHRCRSLRSG